MFMKYSNENESLIKVSYKVGYVLAKCGKPFIDGGIVKNCLLEVAEELCPEKSKLFQNLTLDANTVARRIPDMRENMIGQLCQQISLLFPCNG